MKKILVFITAVAVMLTLASCGGNGSRKASVFANDGISIKFSISVPNDSSYGKNGVLLEEKEYKIAADTTLFDCTEAICEKEGIEIVSDKSVYDEISYTYVTSIGGLKAGEITEAGTWMFSVNEQSPVLTCDSVTLKDGDIVNWYYYTESVNDPENEIMTDNEVVPDGSAVSDGEVVPADTDTDISGEVVPDNEVVPDDEVVPDGAILSDGEVIIPDSDYEYEPVG